MKVVRNDHNTKPFLKPVDWEDLGLPIYPQTIINPMDLKRIGWKLDQGRYEISLDFL